MVLSAALALSACGSSSKGGTSSSSSGAAVKLSLVAYSTPQAAYEQLIAAFQKTPAGKNITFSQSYGASGDQSRAVVSGLKADVVEFSLAPDMTRLVKASLVAPTWDSDQYKGNITDSNVVLAARKGNPKDIKDWSDLIKPGVSVIVPNPITSGGARWDIMAAYGTISNKGADKTAGVDYLQEAVQERRGAGRQRPQGAADLHQRQGRRPHLLRERRDLRPAERPVARHRQAVRDDPDREPDRRDDGEQAPQGSPGFRGLPVHASRPRRSSPTTATGRWSPA